MIVMTMTAMMFIMNDALTCAGGAVSFMTRGEAEVNFGQSGPGDLKHNDVNFHKNAIATANAPLLSVLLEYSNTDPYDTGVYSISRKIFSPRIDEVGPVLDEAGAQFLFLVLVVKRTLKKQVFYGYPDHKGEEFHPYQPVF